MDPTGGSIVWEPYPFPESFVDQILALAAQSGEFALTHPYCLQPDFFGRPGAPRRVLVEEIARHGREYRTAPSAAALEVRFGDRYAARPREELAAAVAVLRRAFEQEVPDRVFVVDRAVQWARDQALRRMILQAADMLDPPSGQRRPSDMAVVRRLVDEALMVGNNGNLGSDLFAEERTRMLQRAVDEAGEGRVPTAFGWLNHVLHGGGAPGELYVWLGGPKAGKSTVLLSAVGAGALLKGRRVLHVSVADVGQAQVADAYDMRLTGLSMAELRANPREGRRMLAHVRRLGARLRIKYLAGREATIDAIYALATRLRAVGFEPDVLIVDFLNRMRGAEQARAGGEVDRTASLTRDGEDLRQLARELSVPIWTAAQGTRAAFQRAHVTMAHIAWAYELGAIVDLMVAICQPREGRVASPPVGWFEVIGARGEYSDGAREAFAFHRSTLTFSVPMPGTVMPGGAERSDGREKT